MKQAAADLEKYDQCKEEVRILRKNNTNLDNALEAEKSYRLTVQGRLKEIDADLMECRRNTDILLNNAKARQAEFDKQTRKQKRKNTIGQILYFATGAAIGFITGAIIAN